jgi:hypothetical protein
VYVIIIFVFKKNIVSPYPKTATGSLVENTKALSEKLLRNSAKPLPCVMGKRYDGINYQTPGTP